MKKWKIAVAAILGSLLIAVAGTVLPRAARAEGAAPQVTGIGYYYDNGDASDSGIDVLSVTGQGDVFVRVSRDGEVIADRLHYSVGAGDSTGVVSLDINSFDADATYEVEAFSDRGETSSLYEGTVSAVVAMVDGRSRVIGTLTKGDKDSSRAFEAPATITREGVTYTKDTTTDGSLSYSISSTNPDAFTGHITYVDDDGTVLKTTDIEGITRDQSQTVSVDQIVTVGSGSDAKYYRSVTLNGQTVTATYGGTKDFTILCKPLSDGSDGTNQFYFATVNLVDQDGATLATDTLNVTKRYYWTAPSRLYLTKGGTTHVYKLVQGDTDTYSDGVLTLDPSKDGATGSDNRSRTYTIAYEDATPATPSGEDAWTVELINGTADPDASDRVISTEKMTASDTYDVKQSIDVNGITYVPTKATKDSYTYEQCLANNGNDPIQYIYYVPADYTPAGDRTVTVNYVNIVSGATVAAQTYTLTPDDTEDLSITSPTSFVQGGVDYVRLDGQESPIVCGYYTRYDTYTVYYRDINDDIAANTTITHFRVEYVDNGTTDNGVVSTGTAEGASAGTATSGTSANGTAADGTQTVGLSTDSDLSTVNNGGDTADVVNGSGDDSGTVRIDDNQTPLSSGQDEGTSTGLLVAGGCGIAAIAAIVVLLVMRRKKNGSSAANGQ